MEEEGGELTLEAEEEVLTKADVVAILEILVEEVKSLVPVSLLVKELTNLIFNSITVKSMDIMHKSAERDNIIKTSKVKIRHTMEITKLTLCLWSAV
jgi:hypothetical protein